MSCDCYWVSSDNNFPQLPASSSVFFLTTVLPWSGQSQFFLWLASLPVLSPSLLPLLSWMFQIKSLCFFSSQVIVIHNASIFFFTVFHFYFLSSCGSLEQTWLWSGKILFLFFSLQSQSFCFVGMINHGLKVKNYFTCYFLEFIPLIWLIYSYIISLYISYIING